MTDTNNIILFLDTLGRTILGKENTKASSDKILAVENPAVLNIVPTQQGNMQVQIIPLVFRELLADVEADVTWNFKRAGITECDKGTLLNTNILSQYANVTSPQPQAAQAPAPEPPVAAPPATKEPIKLFDEE